MKTIKPRDGFSAWLGMNRLILVALALIGLIIVGAVGGYWVQQSKQPNRWASREQRASLMASTAASESSRIQALGTPQADADGFYSVGNFALKLTLLSGALKTGVNTLQLTLCDGSGQRIKAADLRAVAQRVAADGTVLNHTPVLHFAATGDGEYRADLYLEDAGEYTLAADISTPDGGHGDLILRFNTAAADLSQAATTQATTTQAATTLQALASTPEGIAYYSCSMHASVREAGPGVCPICSMDLLPISLEQVQSGVINVDSRRRQLIGLKTAVVQRKALQKTLRAYGRIDYDKAGLSDISLKYDAWIDDLAIDDVGAKIERGQVLFSVYSPDLLAAEQEYLASLQRLSERGADDRLVQAARKRLMLWGITAQQVDALAQAGEALASLPVVSSTSGTVVALMVRHGSHIKAGETVLRIADLSTVWVNAEIYESDLAQVHLGMPTTVHLPYQVEGSHQVTQVYPAKVAYIYPYLDAQTRTARVRLELDNSHAVLKPEMYVEVNFQIDLGEALSVPEEAVLVAGESRVVFKDLGTDGRLKPVWVTTGLRADGWIEIIDGLNEGDRIVTSGNFLIAAEAKLKTGISQW